MITAKQRVLYYLQANTGWVSGYELEEQAHSWGYTAGNITRRARELVEAGAIERRLGFKNAVEYRVKHERRTAPVDPSFDPNAFLRKLAKEEQLTKQGGLKL